tara:strand:- start:26699 stop:27121 length:423 start_codon:yes stop_codon:yes gene_type:complete
MQTMKELWKDNGTTWMLEQFGLWANQPPDLKLTYPKKTNFAVMQGRIVCLPKLDDEIAGFMHDCLNELGERFPECKSMIEQFYIKRRTLENAGKYSGLKRAKAIEALRRAEAWIDCKLYEHFRLTTAQRIIIKMALAKVG